MNKNQKAPMSKKVLAAGLVGVAILGGAAGAVSHALMAEPVVQTVVVEKNVTVEVPYNVTVEKIVEVPVNVTVEKVVEVENEAFKQLACDRLLFDDVKECQEEVEAEDVALSLAVAEIEAEFAEYLDDEDVVSKDSDVRIIEIKTDFEDIVVVKSNFDNDKYVFEIEVKYEDERAEEKETVVVKVEVEDSEAKIVSVN